MCEIDEFIDLSYCCSEELPGNSLVVRVCVYIRAMGMLLGNSSLQVKRDGIPHFVNTVPLRTGATDCGASGARIILLFSSIETIFAACFVATGWSEK